MIGKVTAAILALAGTAQAHCMVYREGIAPPARVENVRDEDCAAFKKALQNGEPVAQFFDQAKSDEIRPGPTAPRGGK